MNPLKLCTFVASIVVVSAVVASPAFAAPLEVSSQTEQVQLSELPAEARKDLNELRISDAEISIQHRQGFTMVADGDAWAIYRTAKQ